MLTAIVAAGTAHAQVTAAWSFTVTAAETDQNGDPVLTEGGASITATATITNGVTFASAQTVTLAWGDASLTGRYVVGAGNATTISIAVGQASGSLTISSPDIDTTPSYTPPKEDDLTAKHAGTEIGSVNLIRLDDEQPPVATIAAVPTTVTEGEDIAIEVRLNLPFDGARFVSFDVTDTDSALSGTKVRFNGVFGYGDTIKTTTFSADDNSIQNDGARTATVALFRDASRDYTPGDPSSVVVTVLDNDSPPTAPRNLTATAISETQIDLDWEEPVKTIGLPITGYRIEVSTDASNWSDLVADTESTDTNYEHTGLAASTTRYYQVSAINAIGTGSASDAASATTRKAAFVPTANADGSTTLLEADMTVVSMAHGGGSLDSTGMGYYQFAGAKYGDLDPPAFIHQGTTIHIGAIQTEPGGTCAEDGNKGELTLWDGSGNWDDLGFVKPVLHLGSKTFAFADANEQTASFVKWHCVDDGDIGWSDGAMLTVKIVLANEPSAPTNLTATATYASEIDLRWDAPAKTGGRDINGYRIEVSTDSSTWTDLVADTESTDTDYRHTGLTAGSTRYYQVSAINAIGTGTASATASVTTSTVVGSALSADGSETLLTATLTVGQAESSGVPLQTYGYSHGGGYGSLDDTDFAIGSTTYTVAALVLDSSTSKLGLSLDPALGTRRARLMLQVGTGSFDLSEAAVTSLSAGGASYEWSNPGLTLAAAAEVAVKVVRLHAPGAPTGLTATARTSARIDLEWEAPATDGGRDITGYRIEVSTDSSLWTNLEGDTESTDTEYKHSGLTAGATRYYRVSAINAIGTGSTSDAASATTRKATFVPTENADGSTAVWMATLTVDEATGYYGQGGSGYYNNTSVIGSTGFRGGLDPDRFTYNGVTHVFTYFGTGGFSGCDGSGANVLTLWDGIGAKWRSLGFVRPVLHVGTRTFAFKDAADKTPGFVQFCLAAGAATLGWYDGYTETVKIVLANEPSAPTNLTARATYASEIDLGWDAPAKTGGSPITGYKIEVSTDGNTWTDLVADTESTDTDYRHTGLSASSTRYYQVSAINAIVTGSASATASATTSTVVGSAINADGSETLLTATLTVGQAQSLQTYGYSSGGGYGSLGNTNFFIGATTYTVAALVLDATSSPSKLGLSLNPALGTKRANLGLEVGAGSFDLSAAAVASLSGGAAYEWSNPGLTLAAAAEIAVKVVRLRAPGAPTGLAATATTPTRIDLDWDAPATDGGRGITGYRIEVSTDGNAWSDLVADTESADTYYEHTGLTASTTRYYQVSALNAIGTGTASATASATTSTVANAALNADGSETLLTATMTVGQAGSLQTYGYSHGGSYGSLDDTDFAIGSTTYTVAALVLDATSSPSKLGLSLNPAPGTRRAILGLEVGAGSFDLSAAAVASLPAGGAAYEWSNPGLTLAAAAEVAVKVVRLHAPGAPTGLAATATSSTQIDLDWNAPAKSGGRDITGYRIEVSTDGNAWSELVADTESPDVRYEHTGLAASTTRHYRVSALNAIGTGSASDATSATTFETDAFVATENADGSTTVWMATLTVEEATGYYGQGGSGYYNTTDLGGARGDLDPDRFIYNGVTHTLSYFGTNGFSRCGGSGENAFTLWDFAAKWDSLGFVRPVLHVGTRTFAFKDAAEKTPGFVNFCLAGGAATLGWYDGYTETVKIVLVGDPSAPTNLTARATYASEIDLGWDAPAKTGGSPITGYKIEVSTDGNDWTNLVADTESTDTEYRHTGLSASSTRYYRVSAINAIVTGSASATASATTSTVVGSAINADGSETLLTATLTVGQAQSLQTYGYSSGGGYGSLGNTNFFIGATTYTVAALVLDATSSPSKLGLSLNPALGTKRANLELEVGAGSFDLSAAAVASLSGGAAYEWSNPGLTLAAAAEIAVKVVRLHAPGAPTGLAATATTPTRIDLDWDAPATDGGRGITGYRIEVSTAGNAWSDLVADTESADVRYEHTGLAASTTRHYQVSALNAIGTGSASDAASATTTKAVFVPKENADGSTTVLEADMTVGSMADGGGALDSDGTGYYEYLGKTGDLDPRSFIYQGSTTRIYALQTEPNGSCAEDGGELSLWDGLGNWDNLGYVKPVLHIGSTTFAFADADEQAPSWIQWFCVDDDDVGWSDDDMLTVKIVLVNEPSAPRNLAATVASATEIGLSWAAPAQTGGADITGYEYRYSTDGGDNWGAWTAIASSAGLTSYTVSGLDTTSTHTFQLRAVNSSGAGAHADTGAASTDASLSGLTLSGGTLTPAFAAATTSYAATVANTVSRVTVTPVRNHTGATVAYLDGSDAALADADLNTDHQQVDLIIGPNTIKVKVTAEDGTTVQTYTVVVTRTDAPPVFTSATTADAAENTTAVLTVAAADPDSQDSVTGYSLAGGADAGLFTLGGSTGTLSFTAAPNFEDAQDADGDNDYLVTVRATSGSGTRLLTADQTMTITVTDDDTEAPAAPAAPTVAPGSDSTTLSVTWNAPANAGPAITGYDVQYRQGTSGTFTPVTHTGTATSSTITSLTAETDYQAQVRARNAEGDSAWSSAGAGTTSQAPNGPPAFTSAATASVVENTTAVLTVAAADPDSQDSVTGYSLAGGADAGRFTLDAATGSLSFTAAPNFEDPADADGNNAYLVTVRATSGSGTRLLTADQTMTIAVTDDDTEAPAAPAAPTVAPGSDSTKLSVTWNAPANAGPPITGYDVEYRQGTSGTFAAGTHTGTSTSTSITGLTAETAYQVQVRARNAEGDSTWSPTGAGTTSQAPNGPPAFTSAATASVVENTTAVLTVEASDPDIQDSVTGYTLAGGADAGLFTLDGSTGALSFTAAPNFEDAQDAASSDPANAAGNNEYLVTVRATSGSGTRLLTADQTITITVTDDDSEAPAAPAAPTVTPGADTTSLSVAWSAPANAGPPIDDYDVQYRQGTSGAFTAWTHTGDATSTTITGLTAETGYEVQVRARSPEGDSEWSPSGAGTAAQAPNAVPAFTSAATASVVENTTAAVLTVEASDSDSQDSVTGYQIAGGADAGRFTLDGSTGALSFAAPPDFENAQDADGDHVYQVIVRATGGSGDRLRTADQTIAVTVTDDDSEAPAAPAAPTVAPGNDATSLDVTWDEPDNAGPAITEYDVQYRQGSSGAFTPRTHDDASTSTTITGLTAHTEYEVQVKARNLEGDSAWSPSGTGTTAQAQNLPPAFTSPAAVSIAENTISVLTVAASDPDSQDSVTGYALAGGADAARFTLDGSTGELQFATPRNFEDPSDADGDSVYEVIVRATGGSGDRLLTGDQTIAVAVTDDDSEAPAAPAAPTVTPGSDATSLDVTWNAPANTGPPITGYDVQYRQGTSGAFTAGTHADAATSTTITGLTAQTGYEVQVKARNPEGESAWSPSGTGTTAEPPNGPPAFTSAARASVVENTSAVLTVAAADPDSQDSVTGYSLAGGADAARFTLDDSTGELQFATPRNFEDPSDADGDSVYEVIVRATSGSGDRLLTGDQTIAVTVTDDDSEAPAAPAAPTVTSGSDATSLNVAWNAPANTGPPISDYDVQYRQGTSGAFTAWQHDGATTGTTITGLTAQTGYEVQVKARNPEGESAWSPSATGTTAQSKAVAENEDRTMFMPQHVDGSAQLRVGGVMVTVEITNGDAPDGMTLILASSALQQGATITFNVTSQGVPDPPAGFRLGTLTVDIELTGIDLDGTMATVCLPAAEDEPATMYRYDAEAGVWTELESTVKTVDGVRCVCATTDHFSLFALLQRPAPPVAPQRLRVHAEDSSRAELSWMAPAIGQDDMALQGYRVELCTAPCDAESSWESVVADTGSTRTAWTHEGLAPGAIRQHRYRVRAIDTMGQVGEASNVAELPPTEVSGLQATAIDPTTIRLRFVVAYPDGNDVLVRYRKVGDPGTGGVASLPLTHQGEVIFLLEGLQPDTAYEITLDFVDSFDSERAQTIRAITPTVSPVAKAWLARFGRTAAGHVLDAVAERLHGRGPAPSQATIAGHRLRRAADSALAADRWHARLLKGGVQDEMRTLPLHELVADSSFHLAAAATGAGGQPDGGSRWSVWGRGAWSRFAGADEGLDLDGEVLSVTAGADYEQDHLLGGLAVSYSTGAGSFDHPAGDSGELRSTLLGVYPYLRLTLHDRLAVWGLFGYAPVGDLSLESRDAGSVDTGAVMLMGAFGARGALLEAARTGGFELAAEADGLLLRMRSVAVPELVATVATVRRLRLRLNASWSALPVLGGVLTPALEVGGRYDSGDAETGAGLLVGGSLSYALPAWGLTLTGAGQGLLLHETDGFSEWGAGGSLRLDPGTPGRGLALHVAPSWGTASAGGGTRLWSLPDASDLAAAGHFAPAPRLEAALSYGLDFPGAVDGLLIPYAGVALAADGERTWRLGSRLHIDPSFSLSLESVRTETHAAIDHSLRLTASVR